MAVVLWQALVFPGSERAVLRAVRGGFELSGTVVAAIDGAPIEARYLVTVDARWHTRSAEVEIKTPEVARGVFWSVDEAALWWSGGREIAALRGAIDVDLGVSPSTNTLPIRRLDIPIGETREVTAAWVRFPDLAIEPLAQRYTRLGATTYRYASDGFSAELEVDGDGLVVRYEGGWQRVASDPR